MCHGGRLPVCSGMADETIATCPNLADENEPRPLLFRSKQTCHDTRRQTSIRHPDVWLLTGLAAAVSVVDRAG